jgi:hypothetical protein
MISTPPTNPAASDPPANITFSPTVIIGPLIDGSVQGSYNASSVNFYVQTNTGDLVQASYYTTTQGWTALPFNQQVTVSGESPIAWQLIAGIGSVVRMLMGPAQ